MAPYAHHPQHYLSNPQSHRLLAYKPPPPPPQQQSFIPTTSATNHGSKRSRSPSGHSYSSTSSKSSRSSLASQMHQRERSHAPHPSSFHRFLQVHPVLDPPIHRPRLSRLHATEHHLFPSPQNSSAFSAYLNYMGNSSAVSNASAPYAQFDAPRSWAIADSEYVSHVRRTTARVKANSILARLSQSIVISVAIDGRSQTAAAAAAAAAATTTAGERLRAPSHDAPIEKWVHHERLSSAAATVVRLDCHKDDL